MPVTLSIEVYEAFEKSLGKEDAKRVVHSLEETISHATEYKWATTRNEIIDEFRKETGELRSEIGSLRKEIDSLRKEIDSLRKEFITRELFQERLEALGSAFEGKIENVKTDLEGKIENVKTDLEGKIENVKTDLEGKIENVKTDLEGRIENVKTDLEGKIEVVKADLGKVSMKLNFLIILVIIALTLMNPVAADLIKSLLGI